MATKFETITKFFFTNDLSLGFGPAVKQLFAVRLIPTIYSTLNAK